MRLTFNKAVGLQLVDDEGAVGAGTAGQRVQIRDNVSDALVDGEPGVRTTELAACPTGGHEDQDPGFNSAPLRAFFVQWKAQFAGLQLIPV